MTFTSALLQFQYELLKEYGLGSDITKIGLPTDLFERVVMELKTSMRYGPSPQVGELYCMGVQILRRDKDEF